MSTQYYRKCSKCLSTAAQNMEIPFFRFPKPGKDNVLKAKAWAIYCWPDKNWNNIEDLLQLHKQSKVICGRHFEESCFLDSSKKKISKFAVPGPKEHVVKLMSTLRKQMSLEQKDISSTDNITPGSSKQQDILVPACKKDKDISSAENITAEPSKQQDFLAPACTKNKDISYTGMITAGPSKQQDFLAPACTKDKDISSADNITAGTSRQQDVFVSACTKDKSKRMDNVPAVGPASAIAQRKRRLSLLKSLNTVKHITFSETEKKLYKFCKNALKEINRLRRKIKNKKEINTIEKLCCNEHIHNLLNKKLSNSFILLLQSQIKNCPKKPKGRRYNLDEKILALGIYKKSPATYRLLRRFIALPSQSTLIKLLNRVPLKPGINKQIFNGLKNMAEKQTDEENICVLVFDEMSIRNSLNYNPKLDLVEGFQDHGDNHGRSCNIASNALVFMACGIRKKWKQPVAFYMSGKSVTADRLAVLIKEVLTECLNVGINVLGTVCDMSAVNTKALKTLGATQEYPFFTHQAKEIVTIADPPHLLKCTRNMLQSHDIECDVDIRSDQKGVRGIAKWSHIRSFYDLDNRNPNFVYAPALSEKHLNPNSKQKMRVKLAAQVFSHSVTAEILSKVTTGELPVDALATGTLLKKFDDLFDALNADTPDAKRGKKHSTNMTSRSPHLKLFEDMKLFISKMKFIGSSRNPPSQSGWICTINAVTRLWRNLNSLGIHSLSTRRLNQDPLENFFGCVRYNCGSNNNPTVSQFIAGVKTAIISNLRHTSTRKNCEDDNAALVDNLKAFLMTPALEEDAELNFETELLTVESELDLSSPETQACAYVCGFIVKRMRNENCNQCKKALLSNDKSEPAHLFTAFKEFDQNKKSLKYVSTDLVQAVEYSACIVNEQFRTELHKENIKLLAMAALQNVDFNFLEICKKHFMENVKFIKTSVFHIAIKRHIVLKNRSFAEEEQKKQMERKLKILKNQ